MAGNVDGKGVSMPKETSPKESVDVGVRSDVPGGESSRGPMEGPNPGGSVGGKKKY